MLIFLRDDLDTKGASPKHHNFFLQIPKSKTKLFGKFSKIEPKIRKISQLQSAPEIALVDEFHRNQSQMKGLGLNFQKKIEKIFFDNYCMFYSCLNTLKIRIFGKVGKLQIWYDFISLRLFQKLIFSKFFFLKFQSET